MRSRGAEETLADGPSDDAGAVGRDPFPRADGSGRSASRRCRGEATAQIDVDRRPAARNSTAETMSYARATARLVVGRSTPVLPTEPSVSPLPSTVERGWAAHPRPFNRARERGRPRDASCWRSLRATLVRKTGFAAWHRSSRTVGSGSPRSPGRPEATLGRRHCSRRPASRPPCSDPSTVSQAALAPPLGADDTQRSPLDASDSPRTGVRVDGSRHAVGVSGRAVA